MVDVLESMRKDKVLFLKILLNIFWITKDDLFKLQQSAQLEEQYNCYIYILQLLQN